MRPVETRPQRLLENERRPDVHLRQIEPLHHEDGLLAEQQAIPVVVAHRPPAVDPDRSRVDVDATVDQRLPGDEDAQP